MRTLLSIALLVVATGWVLPGCARTDAASKVSAEVVGEVRCPVMGGVVKDPSTAAKSEYKGRTYYFCCPGCKPKFDADPEQYVGKAAPRVSSAPAAAAQGKQVSMVVEGGAE